MPFRVEHDSLGDKRIENGHYYGIHTERALSNFENAGPRVPLEIVHAMAQIKAAAAQVNAEQGFIADEIAKAIKDAAFKVADGLFDSEFRLPAFQGGAGTSLHMNVNEVITNIALESLGHKKGEYNFVHPNDHVNLFQSTNDVFPSALKVAAIRLLEKLEKSLADLQSAFQDKEKEYKDVIKIGRTQLQDAMPVTIGQEFGSYAEAIGRDRWRVYKAMERLRVLNLGGTAIGTGTGAPKIFIFKWIEELRKITGLGLSRSENTIECTQNSDAFVEVSGILKTVASNFLKISNDLRLLNSGPAGGLSEINLPEKQAGSSIMPGKINPVIAEFIGSIAMQVSGMDNIIFQAASAGQLELNAFLPLIAYNLLESVKLLQSATVHFINDILDGLIVNKNRCNETLEESFVNITLLSPYIGYERAAQLFKRAKSEGISIKKAILDSGLFELKDLEMIFDVKNATGPGIPGSKELKQKLNLGKHHVR